MAKGMRNLNFRLLTFFCNFTYKVISFVAYMFLIIIQSPFRDHLVNTLRQSMLQLESNVPLIFMHANWHLMRKAWIQALNTSGTPREFARALTVLQCCLKPVVMLNVWYDSLGHTQLKKITQQMKDDKKKMEKRERKELEEVKNII